MALCCREKLVGMNNLVLMKFCVVWWGYCGEKLSKMIGWSHRLMLTF